MADDITITVNQQPEIAVTVTDGATTPITVTPPAEIAVSVVDETISLTVTDGATIPIEVTEAPAITLTVTEPSPILLTVSDGVQSVTGDGVDNTDPDNPVLSFPNTDEVSEGAINLYLTAARVRSTVLTGLSLVTSQAIAATDTILQALGYLQAQITAIATPYSTVNIIIDGGTQVITTGVKCDWIVDFDCTIISVSILATDPATGSIVLDLWRDTYGHFPPTVLDSICGLAKPTLSGAASSQDTTLNGWLTTLTAGQTVRVNVDSIASLTKATLSIKIKRT